MSEKLNTIAGKQNDFATRFMGGGTISIGSNGDMLELTPPAGQKVRLTHLSTEDNAGANESNISVIFGSETVINQDVLSGHQPTVGQFSIGSYQPYTYVNPASPSGNYEWFTGDTDEVLVINKSLGNTLSTIYYGYEYGE